MKKNFKHVLLGTFIDESLKCANLTMTHLCKETGMGKASYENIKKGSPDKPGGLSIQLCKSEKKEFYIRYSS